MQCTQLIVIQCEISNDGKVKVIMGVQKKDIEYSLGGGEISQLSQGNDFLGEI